MQQQFSSLLRISQGHLSNWFAKSESICKEAAVAEKTILKRKLFQKGRMKAKVKFPEMMLLKRVKNG